VWMTDACALECLGWIHAAHGGRGRRRNESAAHAACFLPLHAPSQLIILHIYIIYCIYIYIYYIYIYCNIYYIYIYCNIYIYNASLGSSTVNFLEAQNNLNRYRIPVHNNDNIPPQPGVSVQFFIFFKITACVACCGGGKKKDERGTMHNGGV
jgi:hypothetical protein